MFRDYVANVSLLTRRCFILRSYFSSVVTPSLELSRGIETPGSKLFMRSTSSVVVLDVLVYVPALYMYAYA